MAKKKEGASKEVADATAQGETGIVEDTSLDISGGERDAIYKKYEDGYNAELTESPAGEGEAEEKTDKTLSEEEKIAGASPEEEEAVKEDTETEGKEEKTVPLSALHEEREKRKSLSLKVSELENQLRDVLQDYKARFEVDQKETEEELDDVGQLRKELEDMKKWRKDREVQSLQQQIEGKRQNLNKQIGDTNEALEKEGYPGFDIAISAVTRELQRLVTEDPENAYLDKPEGWKKIYREKVFPKLRASFIKEHKEKIMDEKKELKKDAGLIGEKTKFDTGVKKEEEWTYNDYLQMRYDKQL